MDEAENCHRLAFIYQGRLIAEGTPVEMKEHQMPAQVVEIDCDEIDAALTTLRASNLFDEVALYGSLIHAIGAEAGARVAQAVELLKGKGITVRTAAVILPSLEDVFIARLRHADQGAAK